MEVYQIVLLILLIVGFSYFLLLFYVISHVIEFSRRLEAKLRAMNILLSEKASAIIRIGDDFLSMGAHFSEADKASLEALPQLVFDPSTYEVVCANRVAVEDAYKHISFLASTNRWATKSETYIEAKSLIDDIDKNFRQCSVLYNGDLAGYNYWLTIPGTRLFSFIFGFRKGKQVA